MAKIQYADKTALYNNPDIADINKVKDTDMNEIKRVVNQNADTLNNKVDKVSGKQLSTNDFSNTEKEKLASASELATINASNIADIRTQISGIVESGSNENGNWIKWSDGTMICTYKSPNIPVDITTPEGQMFWGKIKAPTIKPFPQQFVKLNSFSLNCTTYELISISCSDTSSSTRITEDMYFYAPVSFANYNVNYSYIAVGRWK